MKWLRALLQKRLKDGKDKNGKPKTTKNKTTKNKTTWFFKWTFKWCLIAMLPFVSGCKVEAKAQLANDPSIWNRLLQNLLQNLSITDKSSKVTNITGLEPKYLIYTAMIWACFYCLMWYQKRRMMRHIRSLCYDIDYISVNDGDIQTLKQKSCAHSRKDKHYRKIIDRFINSDKNKLP